MKKGFTMIELIFVIVILGILASVAIPRLAATRTDAEIAATVANLRTLVSDAASYYAVKGEFTEGADGVKWNEFTNVPLKRADKPAAASGEPNDGILTVGGENCIAVKVINKKGNIPAHIVFAKKSGGDVCTQVQNAAPVRAFVEATIEGVNLGNNTGKGAIAIGSSTTIY